MQLCIMDSAVVTATDMCHYKSDLTDNNLEVSAGYLLLCFTRSCVFESTLCHVKNSIQFYKTHSKELDLIRISGASCINVCDVTRYCVKQS